MTERSFVEQYERVIESAKREYARQLEHDILYGNKMLRIMLPERPKPSRWKRLRNRGRNAVYRQRMKLASAIAGFDVEDRW